jgi:uncharacterized protein
VLRQLGESHLEALALGAAVLGTGGGGDPYIGKLLARQAIAELGPVTVLDPEDIADDALCAMSAVMGAPTVLVEKPPSGEEQARAFRALETHLGRSITHVICAEVGGLNSMLPIVAAARMSLPLVDCDAMGRAFPEIQMSTPTLSNIAAAPMAVADEKGNTVLIEAIDNHWTERLARSACIDMGACAYIALYVQTGAQVKEAMIGGTLRLAEDVGRALLDARAAKVEVPPAVAESLGGICLFQGKISDVQRRTEAGFARGQVVIDGSGPDKGSSLQIQFQNENLAGTRDGEVVATVPDLIIVLEAESGAPITTEELRYGYRVVVIGAPCNRRWRSVEGLELVGPRYFGYEIDYVPVEDLAARRAGRANP